LSPGNASVTGCRDGDGERAERGERCDSGALALALLGELSAFLRQRYINTISLLDYDYWRSTPLINKPWFINPGLTLSLFICSDNFPYLDGPWDWLNG